MNERLCPDCGTDLAVGTRNCLCGWGMAKAGAKGVTQRPQMDDRCTASSATGRCRYPVGLFAQGERSGKCLFHRQQLQPGELAEIIRQSETIGYAAALRAFQAKARPTPAVLATREAMAQRAHLREESRKLSMDDVRAQIGQYAKDARAADPQPSQRRAVK